MTSERELILESLMLINENGAFANVVEKDVLDKYDYLLPNQKAFIKRVIDGTEENLLNIDRIINEHSKTKVDKQKPLIRNLLRMSVYQIVYMDKVPASAVVNEAVKLAKKRGFKTFSGFVNGVLRTVARLEKDEKISPDDKKIPEWIHEHLLLNYGEEKTKAIEADVFKTHPVSVRIRSGKADEKYFTTNPLMEGAYTVNKGYSIKDIPGYDEGAFIVQDVSSMSVCVMAGIKPTDVVIDVCASPGGKSIHAADMAKEVYSFDLTEKKVEKIIENAKRCRVDNLTAAVQDATIKNEELTGKADVLIADLPCSGLGVMGKKSDIMHKTKKEDLAELVKIQKKIIDNIWDYVKVGGLLMYSTCTLNPDENENRVSYIVENYPFVKEDEKTFIPGIDHTDGFYVARLRRKA